MNSKHSSNIGTHPCKEGHWRRHGSGQAAGPRKQCDVRKAISFPWRDANQHLPSRTPQLSALLDMNTAYCITATDVTLICSCSHYFSLLARPTQFQYCIVIVTCGGFSDSLLVLGNNDTCESKRYISASHRYMWRYTSTLLLYNSLCVRACIKLCSHYSL